MIKVKKKNTETQKIYNARCDECECELECTEEDMHDGPDGAMYITCPECDNEVLIDSHDGIALNSHNIQFPKHFYKFGDAAPIEDERVQEAIRNLLKQMEESDVEDYLYWATGDSMVIVMNLDDEIQVVVAKDYYECSIY